MASHPRVQPNPVSNPSRSRRPPQCTTTHMPECISPAASLARDVMGQLRVGPPLLLVVEGMDLDPAARHVERVCGVSGCDTDSLVNRVGAGTEWVGSARTEEGT